MVSKFNLQQGDEMYLCSDGVVHAGVGRYLSFGWKWDDVASFLIGQQSLAAFNLCNRLLDACNDLYENTPDDDTTVIAVKIRRPQTFMFSLVLLPITSWTVRLSSISIN